MKRIRAVGVVCHEGNILLVHRIIQHKEYETFPGGGVEDNETIEQAAKREVFEETGVTAQFEKLLYVIEDEHTIHNFLLFTYVTGDLKREERKIKAHQGATTDRKPNWFPIKALHGIVLYPLEVRDWIIEDSKIDFAGDVRNLNSLLSERRT